MHSPSKVVVFDMDETLGYFVEFGIFWEAINAYFTYEHKHIEHELLQVEFNSILNLYPEFIRPNIYSILNYLKHKMKSSELTGVMIYTNNQGPKPWVTYIKNYFEGQINYNLFIHIIAAFKVNGKKNELCRTTCDKTLQDFIKCSKIPINTQICFLDDTYFPNMNKENVYYIKVKPYIYDLSFETMIQRFINSSIGKRFLTSKQMEETFFEYINSYMLQFQFLYVNKTSEEYEIDKIVTKKTMLHLQTFFNKNKIYPLLKYNNKNKSSSKKIVKNKTLKRHSIY